MTKRKSFDTDAYIKTIQNTPCFICHIVADNTDPQHHIVYETDNAIVFLNKYPVLYGYCLVAPKAHKEQVTGDFSLEAYLDIQKVIFDTAEALRRYLKPERIYILSLGSQQGNQHVHWHIAPLPFGVPFKDQQLNALRFGNGILELSNEEMGNLAHHIRAELNAASH